MDCSRSSSDLVHCPDRKVDSGVFWWYLGYIFVPGLLICQIFLFLRSKKRHRKKGVIISGVLICSIMLGGCAGAVEPEKRMYALALGVDASEDGLLVSYGMPDLPESTGQGKEEENGSTRVLAIRGENFTQIEEAYDRSQEKFRDLGHLQVLVLGKPLLEDGRWELVLDYLKQEAFVGEDLYVFQAENAGQVLNWQGQDNSSLGRRRHRADRKPDVRAQGAYGNFAAGVL